MKAKLLSALLIVAAYCWQGNLVAQPELTSTAEDLILECGVDVIPPMEECEGTNWTHQHSTEFIITSDNTNFCAAEDNNLGYSLNFPQNGDVAELGLSNHLFIVTSAISVHNLDGTVDIKAEFQNQSNLNETITLVVRLIDKQDWTGWSSQLTTDGLYNRTWKGDPLIVGTNYLNWDYYILDGANSYMTGHGDIDGFHAELSHYPANKYYAVQIGTGANDIDNDVNGIAAWIEYDGVFNCNPVDGFFDSNFNLSVNCTPIELCNNTQYIIRDWTLVDDCGFTDSHTQIIEVKDTTAPTSTMVDASYDVQCLVDVPELSECIWTDACSGVATESSNSTTTTITDECAYTVTQSWTATDSCGNTATVTHVYNVLDTENPVFTPGEPELTLQWYNDWTPEIPTVTDNCDLNIDLTNTVDTLSSAGCLPSFVINWTAEDNCGNTATLTQIINWIDTIAPYFPNPPPAILTAECDDVPAIPEVTALDDCDLNPIITSGEDMEYLDNGWDYTLWRWWTATDECGNSATIWQHVTVLDTQAPVIVCPNPCDFPGQDIMSYGSLSEYDGEDCYYQCASDIPSLEDVQALVTATDNCDANPEVFGELISDDYYSDQWYGMITYRFYAMDDCDNVSYDCYVSFTYWDTTAPEIEPVDNPELTACYGDVILPEMVVAVDNCQDTVFQGYTDTHFGDICEGSIERMFWVTDNCGNYSYLTYTATWKDSIAPVLAEVEPVIELQWDSQYIIPECEAIDNCFEGDSVITWSTYNVFSGNCLPAWEVIWHAEDYCGNYSSVSQIINWIDTVAPTFLEPVEPEVTYDWAAVLPPGECLAWDDCDDDLTYWTTIDTLSGDCLPTYVYTWYAEDNCDNVASISQIVNLIDTIAPVFTSLPPQISEQACDSDEAPWNVTAIDECDENVIITLEEGLYSGGCAHTLSYIWTATDCSGNIAQFQQLITLIDTVAPVAVYNGQYEDGLTVECIDDLPVLTLDDFSVTDNCTDMANSQWVPEFLIEVSGDVCNGTKTFQYIVHDNCWNYDTITVVFNYMDTVDPTFNEIPAAEVTLQWDPDYLIGECLATDNCDDTVNTWYTYNVFSSPNCLPAWEVTWYAKDDCENIVEVSQIINWIDTIAPVFTSSTILADTINCELVTTFINNIPEVNATDDCDQDVEVWHEVVEDNALCNGTITVTWYAEDDCGNITTLVQIIDIIDVTVPVIEQFNDVTINCEDINAFVLTTPWAVDNCTPDLIATLLLSDTTYLENGWDYTYTATWTVVDGCQNSATSSLAITVVDVTAPYLVDALDAYTYMDCADIEVPEVEFADNCSNDITVDFTEVIGDCDYDYEDYCYCITWTWIATDGCDNSITVSQTAMITDDEAPQLVFTPEAELWVDCDQVPDMGAVTAIDNCTDDVTVMATETQEGYTEPYCKATDFNGNGWGFVINPFTEDEITLNIAGDGLDVVYALDGSFTVDGEFTDGNVLHMEFSTPWTWNEWEALGRGWKGDQLGGDPTNLHEDWSYYILESGYISGPNTLVELTHAPSSLYYGYQVGDGANNAGSCYGLGGWAFAEGLLNAEELFYIDNEGDTILVCPSDLITCIECWECNYDITRTWITEDDCGNVTEFVQVIHVGQEAPGPNNGSTDPDAALATESPAETVNGIILEITPNPVMRDRAIKVEPKGFVKDAVLTYQIIDMRGTVKAAFNSADQFSKVSLSGFGPGMYTIKVYNQETGKMSYERFIVQ